MDRADLKPLAALTRWEGNYNQAVVEGAPDERYEVSEELCDWVYLLWPELRPG